MLGVYLYTWRHCECAITCAHHPKQWLHVEDVPVIDAILHHYKDASCKVGLRL